jgi:uncharacterized membrane protein
MQSLLNLIVTLLCVTFILGILFGIFWYVATKKGWNTLGLLSLSITIILIGITIILWIVTKERVILIGGIVLSLIQGYIILNWSTLSPKFVKRLRLRK